MPVPTSGNFDMFGIATNTTIQGAIKQGIEYFNGSTTAIDAATNFNTLISLSNVSFFDPAFAGSINNLSQVTQSIQYRNYPVLPSVPATISWQLIESENGVFVDANFRIFVNNSPTESLQVFGNSSGVLVNKFGSTPIMVGDIIRVQYFYLAGQGISPSNLSDPRLQLFVDNTLVGDNSITPASDLTVNFTFTITANTNILVRGTAVIPLNCSLAGEIECIFATPTPTPANTPTPTPTPTPTNTPTSPTPTPTPTSTFSSSLYTSTLVSNCSDICNSNFTISTLRGSTSDYNSITLGDQIGGITIAGFYAIAPSPTDTNTGPYRIVQTDSSGVVSGTFNCGGGICVPE